MSPVAEQPPLREAYFRRLSLFIWATAAGISVAQHFGSVDFFSPRHLMWLVVLLAFGLTSYRTTGDQGRRPEVLAALLVGQSVMALLLSLLVTDSIAITPILLAVVAAQLGRHYPLRVAFAAVAVQTLLLCVIQARTWSPSTAVIVAAAYLTLQAFAVLSAYAMSSEARARDALTRANAELRALQRLLAERGRADERLRISRDLHDVLGHGLSALSVKLEIASQLSEGETREHVVVAHDLARSLLQKVRDVVSSVREETIVDVAAAIRSLAEVTSEPRIHVSVGEDVGIASATHAHILLRCVEEIVTNTIRHSGARNLWITFQKTAGGFALQALDDGRGSDELCLGSGLRGMKERFADAGGTVDIQSSAESGFRVRAFLPTSGART